MSKICHRQWSILIFYWSYGRGGGGQIFVNSFARLACVYKGQWLNTTLYVCFVDFTKDFILFILWSTLTNYWKRFTQSISTVGYLCHVLFFFMIVYFFQIYFNLLYHGGNIQRISQWDCTFTINMTEHAEEIRNVWLLRLSTTIMTPQW